jgi:phosphoserine phosphatase
MISSGLPTVAVKRLADCVGADYAYGIEVGFTRDRRIDWRNQRRRDWSHGKLRILNEILALEGLTLNDCVVVADDRNNRCLFTPQTKKNRLQPDFIIR